MSEEFQFDESELAELRGMFFEQATEVIDSLGELILKIERDPSDAETLRSIRRAVHPLKGDSTAFGFGDLTNLAHHYEDALDRVRAREGSASRALIDLLLAGADALAALISHYRGECEMPDTAKLISGLDAIRESEEEAQAPQQSAVVVKKAKRKRVKAAKESAPIITEAENVAAADAVVVAVTPDVDFDEESDDKEDVVAAASPERKSSFEEKRSGDERRSGEDRRAGSDRRQGQSQAMTLRVESERIDAAMNLVGELIIQRSMISTLSAEIEAARIGDDVTRRLSEAVALSGRVLSELQESVMRMRLVAIDQVFRRFPRVVRDASVKLGKPLRMEVVGGQTEIDKSIVEIISDPLIHLVRNACDHGVEMPDVRQAAGKNAEGVIRLSARRAGNQIEVEVADDGGGIDPARIVAKAIEKGLIGEQETAEWTDQQKLALIFLPGFSTKEQISDMSGRGVGMDVVKTTVDSLGGSIAVNSTKGAGSRFTIKLPLTMAIVRAMLFEAVGRRFALPLDSIREITRLHAGEEKTIDGKEVMRLRDQVIPLVRVDEALGLRSANDARSCSRHFVFVVDLGDGRDVGLVVERLYGEQELVLKSVDDALSRSAVVAGASILGDGSVVLILDTNAVVEQAVRERHAVEMRA